MATTTEEVQQYTWKAGLSAGMLVAALGLGLTMLSVMGKTNADRYLLVFYNYDEGALLTVLATFGVVCASGGVYGALVCWLSTNRKKLKRLQFMVYAYVAWGSALAFLCFYTYYQVITCSFAIDTILQSGFIDRLPLYASDDDVRISVDRMQTELSCCGSSNLTDWFTVQWSANISMTANAVPESCCDAASLQGRGLQSCVLSVPFGEASKLTTFRSGCVVEAVKFFRSILNTRSLLIIGCGILQTLVIGLVVYELMTLKHVYDAPDKNKETMKLLEKSTEK